VSASHWPDVQRAFDELVELSSPEREGRLAVLERDAPAIHRELISLLAAADSAGDFLGVLEDRSTPDTRPELTGRVAGRYDIERLVGRGAWGEVYLARDHELDRLVALKCLPAPSGADPERVQRFVTEARLAARLDHPHVATVYDIDKDERGYLFIAMPYYSGGTLQTRLRKGPLDPDDAVAVARQIADGLGAAHAIGIVHRDVKPANVLFDADGLVKIADFGVAKLVGHDSTGAGTLVGTLAYMSPEQATGALVDGRSDLWALGVVLYEMLTGARPFQGATTGELIGAIAAAAPLPLARRWADAATLPRSPSFERGAGLQSLIDALFAKDPADRPASAPEVRARLNEIAPPAAQQPATARRPARLPAGYVRWWRRRTFWIPAVATAAVVVAGVLAGPRVLVRPGQANRVVVAPLENRTGDHTLDAVGEIATDWLTQGLTETQLLRVVDAQSAAGAVRRLSVASNASLGATALAQATRAQTAVAGRYYLMGDSIQFQAEIVDARSGEVRHELDAVRAPRSDPTLALGRLRQEVLGALAADLDPHLAGWAARTARTPTYAAYLESTAGLEALWRYDATGMSEALVHFERAAALDPSFVRARLFLARTLIDLGQFGRADSVLRVLAPQRASLSFLDQAYFDRLVANVNGDPSAALRAARRMYELAPGPQTAWIWGYEAVSAGQLREAVTALEAVDPEQSPEMRSNPQYWLLLTDCYHLLGNYTRELGVEQRAERNSPERLSIVVREVAALSALGRIDAVRDRVHVAMTLPEEPGVMNMGGFLTSAAEELHAHGHDDVARELEQQALAWCGARAPAESSLAATRAECAHAHALLQQWDQAYTTQDALVRDFPDTLRFQGELGVVAARRGDRSIAERIEGALSRIPQVDTADVAFYRARIAAALGDTARAVAWLTQSQAHGDNVALMVHDDAAFDPLRGAPAFEAAVRAR
jgi:tetratricopeptide (TPR) repeat protein